MVYEDIQSLLAPVTALEVKWAVDGMGAFKAPGPDGLQPAFYQKCWGDVGPSLVETVHQAFITGVIPEDLNGVLITLILKVDHPESLSQFRPISLCNVAFKVKGNC